MLYRRNIVAFILAFFIQSISGCSGPPELQKIKGRVTLAGKPYERLIVYFRPMDSKANVYNLGVGETIESGELGLRSTAGDGIAPGEYRVSFSCVRVKGKNEQIGASNEKPDDERSLITEELVPFPYNDDNESPVRFEVRQGKENIFEYDIPTS